MHYFKSALIFVCGVLGQYFVMAQGTRHTYIGTLEETGTKALYTYKIDFTDSAGTITGTSVTDVAGRSQTEARIKGKYDATRKELTFNELKIINSRLRISYDNFCLARARLVERKVKGVNVMKGSYTGYTVDGKAKCGSGIMSLVSMEAIEKKMKKIQPDSIPQPAKQPPVVPVQPAVSIQPGKDVALQPGSVSRLVCTGAQVQIDLWDNGKIDGDIVRLEYNGKTLLDYYLLEQEKYSLSMALTGGADTLILRAMTEGTDPPNTARMNIKSVNETYTIDASSTTAAPVVIILEGKK